MCKTSIENESLWLDAVDTYPSPTSTSKIDELLQAQQLNKATAVNTAAAAAAAAVTTGAKSGSLGTPQTRDEQESDAVMATTDRHPTDAEQEERVRAIREAMRGLL